MRNVTLAIEEGVLEAARKVASGRGTTVNRMIREYLAEVAGQEARRRLALPRLARAMKKGLYEVGPRTWTREDLHDR